MEQEPSYKCTKCQETKLVNEFPHGKGKRHPWCRACNNADKKERHKRYREANPRKKRIAEDYLTEDEKAICVKCNEPHPLEHYQGGKGGGWCRKCRSNLEGKRRRNKGIKEKKFSVIENGKKLCMHCLEMKELSEFSPTERGLGGLSAYCRPCAKFKFYDPEKGRENTARYRRVNRERHLAMHRVRMYKYRTRKEVTDDGTVTDEFLKNLYAQENCNYCGLFTETKNRTADHVIALASGGIHSASNLVMACKPCNSSKQDLSGEEFMERGCYGN